MSTRVYNLSQSGTIWIQSTFFEFSSLISALTLYPHLHVSRTWFSSPQASTLKFCPYIFSSPRHATHPTHLFLSGVIGRKYLLRAIHVSPHKSNILQGPVNFLHVGRNKFLRTISRKTSTCVLPLTRGTKIYSRPELRTECSYCTILQS